MPSQYIEVFDFKTIYINYFLGNQALFPFAFVIIFSFIAALLNLSNTVYLILLAIGAVMFGAYMGESIYVLVIFLIGFILFKIFSRLFQ